MTGWRYACASVEGTAHQRLGTVCEDASLCCTVKDGSGSEVLLAVACDGAGSAAHAAVGAKTACQALAEQATRTLQQTALSQIDRLTVNGWCDAVRQRLSQHGEALRDYATTCILVLAGRDAAVYAQVGDGAIVTRAGTDAYACVFWPDRGDYANTTQFLTDDEDSLQFRRGAAVDEVAVLTDGMQRLALQFSSRTVHEPFFRDLFRPLRDGDDDLSSDLRAFLASPRVNARTDDDKTLILATRRRP